MMTARHRSAPLPRRHVASTLRALALTAALAVAAGAHAASTARAERTVDADVVRIALIADVPQWPAAEGPTQQLLESFVQRRVAFVVHAGGIKGDTESCADAVLGARLQLLQQSPLPVVYVPGETDWAECEHPVNGSFDPDERLARLRELFYPDDNALGAPGKRRVALTRQSDQAKFRAYRENVRWTVGKVLMVGMNLPGDNNHYRAEAGRNGEFEDRREANRQWLSRAFSVAEHERLAGIVLVVHGDPLFGNGWEKRGKLTLLDGFMRHRERDGYLEFKRQLRELVSRFDGQVMLVHSSVAGFAVDTPLRDARGKVLRHFTRVALPVGSTRQWTELTITPNARALFAVNLRDGPR